MQREIIQAQQKLNKQKSYNYYKKKCTCCLACPVTSHYKDTISSCKTMPYAVSTRKCEQCVCRATATALVLRASLQ